MPWEGARPCLPSVFQRRRIQSWFSTLEVRILSSRLNGTQLHNDRRHDGGCGSISIALPLLLRVCRLAVEPNGLRLATHFYSESVAVIEDFNVCSFGDAVKRSCYRKPPRDMTKAGQAAPNIGFAGHQAKRADPCAADGRRDTPFSRNNVDAGIVAWNAQSVCRGSVKSEKTAMNAKKPGRKPAWLRKNADELLSAAGCR